MSEYLTIDPTRQEKLKAIIGKLHAGEPVESVKKEFGLLIKGVSAAEVAAMEQALIDGGMPVEEVQRLCEVHVKVFESSLAASPKPKGMPGHPIHTMIEENKLARKKVAALRSAARSYAWGLGSKEAASAALEDLSKIIVHYARKENQLFPFLEKSGFTGPSRVMWGKHDEIRQLFSEARMHIEASPKKFGSAVRALTRKILAMIFMEERILIPESSRRLTEREWAQIRSGEDAIGFSWTRPASTYDAGIVLARAAAQPSPAEASPSRPKADESLGAAAGLTATASAGEAAELLELATGLVPKALLDLALRSLPLDISIVDENDKVLYYSDSPHRLFPRSPAIIGRSVQNCHPQKSVHIVEEILQAFKNGSRSKARFWIEMGGRFVVIEYFALRDAEGAYRGTLELSQDITELRALQGQRRLLDWD